MNEQWLILVFDRDSVMILVIVQIRHFSPASKRESGLRILSEVDVVNPVRVVVVPSQDDLTDQLFDAFCLEGWAAC